MNKLYGVWLFAWAILLVSAYVLAYKNMRKEQHYTAISCLLFIAATVSITVFLVFDLQYRAVQAGLDYTMELVLQVCGGGFCAAFFMILWVAFATLAEYKVMDVSAQNRIMTMIAMSAFSVLTVGYYMMFLAPASSAVQLLGVNMEPLSYYGILFSYIAFLEWLQTGRGKEWLNRLDEFEEEQMRKLDEFEASNQHNDE